MNKMNMEDRIKRLEDIILGKLVVNKESPLEKILLSQGLSEEKILDMQKQMIDYMKNGWLLENAKPVESEPEKTFTEMVEGWMPDQECEEKSKLCKCGHSIDMHMEGMDAKYEWIGHDGNGTTDSSILKQLEGASDNDLLCIDCWCKNFENEKESK